MLNFTLFVSVVGVAVCIGVYLALLTLIIFRVSHKTRGTGEVLPPPDRAAERPYGQQYFERAIGKKK